MSTQPIQITLPVGRIVSGNLYRPNTKDAQGNPLTIKSGPNAGQPRQDFYVAIAIPKTPGHTHWSQTPWGQQIWTIGHTAFPQIAQRPDFAWKITDGDDTIPNKRGKKPCEQEGYPGHWIVKTSSGYAPKVYSALTGTVTPLLENDAVNPGDYVEAYVTVDGNGQMQTPGLYINNSMFCLRGYGQRIVSGPDVSAAGFGQGALPPGASAMPVGAAMGAVPPAPAPYAAPPMPGAAVPPAPGGYAPPPVPGAVPPAPAVPGVPGPVAQVPVTPNPAILNPPAVPAAPMAPPPAPVKQMTAKAGGTTYEAFIATGQWNDALLIQHGYMLP